MPSEQKKFVGEQRTLINYPALEDKFNEYVVVCINRAILDICAKLINSRGRWEATYYTAIFDGYYITPNAAELSVLDQHINNFIFDVSEVNEMTCDLVGTLEAIKNSLVSLSSGSGCGCGSSGAGATDEPATTTETGDIFDDGQTPPEGFETWTEYQTWKCQVATWIVDSSIADIAWLSTLDWTALSAAGLAGGLAFLIPGVNLVALVALLTVTLLGLGIGASVMSIVGDALDAARDDLICALYLAGDVGQAITDYETIRNDAIDAETSDTVLVAMAQALLNYWVSYAAFNKLFNNDPTLNLTGVTGDCSSCGYSCTAIWSFASSEGDWQFEDISPDSEATATGTYDAGNEALKCQIVISYPPGSKTGIGRWYLDLTAVNVIINPGDTLTLHFSSSSLAIAKWAQMWIDGNEEHTQVVSATEGDVVHVASTSGQLEKIAGWIGNSTGPTGPAINNWVYLEEVTLSLSATQDCPAGD